MQKIADWIVRIIREGEQAVPQVKQEVLALTGHFPLYK
jgi:glycine/serine hydroxymethyltransferase